jgi:glycosyltransferase involved in cell wall biosynthesis
MIFLIITAYNEEAELPYLLSSIKSQTKHNFHLVLIDNNSTDSTLDIMRKFQTESLCEVSVLEESVIGKIHALKKGCDYAISLNAEVIALSDADAIFSSTWFENIEDYINSNPDVSFGFSDELFKVDRLEEVPNFYSILTRNTHYRNNIRKSIGGLMYGGSSFIRSSALKSVGGYESNWKKREDTYMSVKLMLNGFKGGYYKAPIWLSPRRLVYKNIPTWINDGNYRKIIKDNWETIRINDLKYKTYPLEDIKENQIPEALEIRGKKLFKITLSCTVFDNSYIKKLENFINKSEGKDLYNNWVSDLENIRKYTEQFEKVDEKYESLKDYIDRHWSELVLIGGKLITESYKDFSYPDLKRLYNLGEF